MKLNFDRKLPDKKIRLTLSGLTAESLTLYQRYQKEQHDRELAIEEIIVRLLETFLASNTEAAFHAWRKGQRLNGQTKSRQRPDEVFTLGEQEKGNARS